jgi:decaprenyl-phosphate phosphoribosyltransferase
VTRDRTADCERGPRAWHSVPVVSTAEQAPSLSVASGLLRTARPKQWLKNILVFMAPAAGGVITEGPVVWRTLLAFVAFCLVASGTYFLNDANDVEADRRHPKKRLRPMAAGAFSVTTGRVCSVVLILAGIGVAAIGGRWEFPVVVAIYAANTTLYSLKLKHVPVFDILSVAAGFLLRAIGGGVATGIPLSDWFLTVASFGSLFIVVGKRFDEHRATATSVDGTTRHVLKVYTESYLRYVRSVATGGVLLSYCLFAFEKADAAPHGGPWFQLSIVPFLAAILKYELDVESGQGETPEDVLLGDRTLVACGAAWTALFLAGVYLTH